VGAAIAHRLVASGWQVDVVGRDAGHVAPELTAAGVGFLCADRDDPATLRPVLAAGADLLVDCICFTRAQAVSLRSLAEAAGSTVMISSKAVYVDDEGRHSNSADAPRFPVPITERQSTMAPADGDYNSAEGYGANKVAAELELLESGLPITVLRPSKIHGPGAHPPREWYFVKRVLDRRAVVLLARGGSGVDHPTAAANMAALVETVAAQPGRRILNIADPDAPTGRQIARTIAAHLGHEWDEVLLDDTADPTLGHHPWDREHPVVLDVSAANALGYRPAGDYSTTVAAELDWLLANGLPDSDASFFARHFDYAAEDHYLAAR
jgi:nucleoside-diphosphate-sugar epimerase